jgi:hypothetical protein
MHKSEKMGVFELPFFSLLYGFVVQGYSMHYIKLLGDKLTARHFQSQVNEIHPRVAVLNKFTKLGRPHTQVIT